MSSASARRVVPPTALASHRQGAGQPDASAPQKSFRWDAVDRVTDTQEQLRQLFCELVRVGGGAEALVAALNREPSYVARISDAMQGREQRSVQLAWLAPLLDDEDASERLLTWLSARCGYEPPVRARRDVPIEDINAAAREVLAEIKDEEQRDLMKKRIAKKLGVRVEDVRL